MQQNRSLLRLGLLILANAGAATIVANTTSASNLTEMQQGRVAAGKVLVFYDMEGASGIDKGDMFDVRQTAAFELGRQHLTADVNAVIAGLFDGGVAGVDVFNTHGSGGDTLVPRRALDSRARILTRRGPRVAYDPANGLADSGYVAVVSIAAHDKPRSGGFSPHTLNIGTSPLINGALLTETDLLAYALGVGNVPMILASGDDVLGRSLARTMPWIEYVVVKRTTASGVDLLPVDRVRSELRAAAARAMLALGQQSRMRPLRVTAPIRAGVLPSFPAWMPPTIGDLPGLERRGDTVLFQAITYPQAFRAMRLLMDMATGSAEGYMLDMLQRTPEGRRLVREAWDTVYSQSAAFERGEFKPPRQYP
jgi:D-amino peptidase